MKSVIGILAALVVWVNLALPVQAMMLQPPQGEVLLSIKGAISNTNKEDVAEFDRAMLESLDWQSIESFTTWTEGKQVFSGVPLRSVLDAVGMTGTQFKAIALNDYSVTIPVSDLDAYDVFLALDRNGQPMQIRDKGPTWVIYPQTSASEGNGPHDEKMIWQLKALEVLAE